MVVRKNQCPIDVVVSLVHKVKSCWTGKKLPVALFVDIQRAFDHVSKITLAKKMIQLGVDSDLI